MGAFKRIVFAAAPAGLAAGLLFSAIQQFHLTPLIRRAEAFEASAHAAPALLATVAANVVLATGFALLLAAALALRGRAGWRAGLAFGLAGYAVFFVAPALGLPPELPGAQAAPLDERTLWWAATVALSAAGLALAAFSSNVALRIVGLALLVAPHLAGAPQAPAPGGAAPAELNGEFVRAAWLANAILWLSIGACVGLLYKSEARLSA